MANSRKKVHEISESDDDVDEISESKRARASSSQPLQLPSTTHKSSTKASAVPHKPIGQNELSADSNYRLSPKKDSTLICAPKYYKDSSCSSQLWNVKSTSTNSQYLFHAKNTSLLFTTLVNTEYPFIQGRGSDVPPCPQGFMCARTSVDHVQTNSHEYRVRGFYLTKCDGLQTKFNADTFTRSLKQILHEDVDDQLESAVHFSYVYDMEWLLNQYPQKYRHLPMMLVVQRRQDLFELLIAQRQVYRNVCLLPVELARFGSHHSKMILLKYKHSLRIVITTANLYGPDWGRKSQMVWVSPMLKKNSQHKVAPDSNTGFRSALCTYLRSYQKKKLHGLAESYMNYDFSLIEKCFFIGSTPNSINSGLVALDSVLTKNVPALANENPVIFSFSSIGTLGQDDAGGSLILPIPPAANLPLVVNKAWLRQTFGRSLLATDQSMKQNAGIEDINNDNIQAIYPTIDEVRTSFEGYAAGRSLPYSEKVHKKQRWLSRFLHHWKADRVGRSRAAPHVKFYIRTSLDYQQTFWFMMTSANLSKAAWGNLRMKAPLSYECGVLYVPDNPMVTDHVVIPFDLPPKKYSASDRLWVQDSCYAEIDFQGNTWDPRKGGSISVAW